MVKSLTAMREIRVQSLCREDPLEKEKVTHCTLLAWRIPRTREPGGLLHEVTKSRTQKYLSFPKHSVHARPSSVVHASSHLT